MTTGIIAALTAIAAALIGAVAWALREMGKADAAVDRWEELERRRKAGEDAAAKERKDTDGLDDDAIRDRLRKRDDDWTRM